MQHAEMSLHPLTPQAVGDLRRAVHAGQGWQTEIDMPMELA
jgi:hypothetical protein